MKPIIVTQGAYAGRVLRTYDLSIDGRYIQVWIGRQREEFKLGVDCVWA